MRIAIFVLLLASASLLPAHAQDSTSLTAQPATNATQELKLPSEAQCVTDLKQVTDDNCYKPPMSILIHFFARTGLSKVSTSVHMTYDEKGRVTSAALNRSTGNKTFDQAIVDWTKFIKLMPGPASEGDLPIDFSLD
jgi:TonB family protein